MAPKGKLVISKILETSIDNLSTWLDKYQYEVSNWPGDEDEIISFQKTSYGSSGKKAYRIIYYGKLFSEKKPNTVETVNGEDEAPW